MDNIDIGEKISHLRKEKNLSIRDLAKLADVTPSLLSQLERGLSNPSLNTIKAISKALDVPLFSFFIDEVNNKDLIVRKDSRRKVIFPKNNDIVFEILSPESANSVEFAIVNLIPYSQISNELMSHKSIELAYVLEGKIKIYIEDDEFILESGDSVTLPPGTNHRWENPFNEQAKIIFSINFK
ncbi:HTH-type transcriptional regulator [[Clostridium] sordellii]|uniref:helix-turn-helix domain-containing protein n=1 Tax=Paraclostridium sordellii TaxID=1505 RepID=UPI0003867ACA|nr:MULTISPECIES: XRE family transcriptional regulator [Paeniclostridium]EPZ62494.1 helix-turn-helix family protein [[Clostridium] sordellii VPI 9048] [Paeniclostridium sordellii VPI 9048]MBW4863787.1 XRE family transcriptional regulator [Paeniclostridium sp.]MBX9179866.1 helix-turn-helix domain-containing protein [Paeniclostridium sordellii]MCQ4696597.1 XRE family transcriptional regulator [Paeniclostridium sordellii]MDU1455379.1 XRE family transcriptional regulator [Paeniclostridium sordellii